MNKSMILIKGYLPLNFVVKIGVGMLFVAAQTQGTMDPEKIIGANTCSECHVSESNAWKNTHHFKTFKELHRRPQAKEIQQKLGLKRIKSESDCMQCHYTAQKTETKNKAISGISCESCHGPAKDWIDIHSDFGGPGITRETETAEHRETRLKTLEKAGMIRPDEIYKLAANCFQCHTVPNEKLVNMGGHQPGSNFELVSWLQGEVRHNFVQSEGKENREASAARRRILYVTGRTLDLEYAFRGVAKAKAKASYAVKMAKRAKRAIARVNQILELKSIPELEEIAKIAKSQKLKLNNEKALTEAADKIGGIAKKMASTYSGEEFSALDPLIPGPDKYKGAPTQ